MSYESKINFIPKDQLDDYSDDEAEVSNHNVEIITKDWHVLRDGKNLGEHTEETRLVYPSVEELRKSLVKRKFHSQILSQSGRLAEYTGAALWLTAGCVTSTSFTSVSQLLLGSSLYLGGILIQKQRGKESEVNSQIRAFNKTFRDLKPVCFSPRDYLSTIRIPFLNEKHLKTSQ